MLKFLSFMYTLSCCIYVMIYWTIFYLREKTILLNYAYIVTLIDVYWSCWTNSLSVCLLLASVYWACIMIWLYKTECITSFSPVYLHIQFALTQPNSFKKLKFFFTISNFVNISRKFHSWGILHGIMLHNFF